ncbi:MAG: ABC transporter ATP-binding protein [Ruminococcaceae bacterium]|nr:ABC transporter ATP-binding protein [Oscillospiraceae bacterium]
MSDIAVKFENVYKEYRLGAIGGGTLRGDLQTLMARIRGKEDPNLKIGATDGYKKNEKFLALTDVSFDVPKGRAVGIIGHNGAGKSTLLKLLSRVTAPTKGNIYIDGRVASMLEVGTGFHAELTGRENIFLNGAILGMTNAEIKSKFDEIVEFAEMTKFIDTPVKRYSSGMYVKLAFAVAAHLDSEILVMDEVLAVGDMKFQQKCLGKMGDVADKEGRTVLYVSHNMNTIRQLCSSCVVLEKGQVIYNGEVEPAIDLYMKNATVDLNSYQDISEKRMKHLVPDYNTKLMSTEILGMENAIIKQGSKIRIKIKWKSKRGLTDDAFLRFHIKHIDDSPVGVFVSPPIKHCMAGETVEQTFELDTSNLQVGIYKVLLIMFEQNEFKTCADIDAVAPAFNFQVLPNDNIIWNSRGWGHVQFNDVVPLD